MNTIINSPSIDERARAHNQKPLDAWWHPLAPFWPFYTLNNPRVERIVSQIRQAMPGWFQAALPLNGLSVLDVGSALAVSVTKRA